MALKPAGVKIYFQPMSELDCGRIRIICPNGNSFWMTGYMPMDEQEYSEWSIRRCCFTREGMTQEQVIEAMREYDERYGYPPAELIGEL